MVTSILPISLTPFVDSTIAFTTAFGLEALVFSSQLWAKLPVGIVLAMILLLISWCAWTAMVDEKDSSNSDGGHPWWDFIVGFTSRLRGLIPESTPDGGGGEDGNDQGEGRDPQRSGPLKEALNFIRGRRKRASTSATLVNDNQPGSSGKRSPQKITEEDIDGANVIELRSMV